MNAVRKRSWTKKAERASRCRQLQRCLTTAYVVRREDHLTLLEIKQRLKEHFCIDVCNRTIERDLDALRELGIVDKSRGCDGVSMAYHFVSCQIFESGAKY